jgi:polyhydroxyalkanoate synthase
MRSTNFDDYVLKGILKATQTAGDICGSGSVHAAGYCIGGTALATMMAWLNRTYEGQGEFPVADWSVFSTLVDFSDPGEIGVFISEPSITYLESLMKSSGGYLDSRYISQTFRLLRSDSLVWRNYVHNYLYGGTPPKSDMLYWNDDSTRMPEAMCSFYLRECYLQNKLTKKDSVVLGGCPIDLGCIEQPLYAVGAQQDHISPWRSTFRIGNLVKGPVRYVLTSEGHIAGIVNPPSELSKRKFWAGEFDGSVGPDAWQAMQKEERGSWWPDWVEWIIPRSGQLDKPPAMGSKKYPTLGKAPGTYVLEP